MNKYEQLIDEDELGEETIKEIDEITREYEKHEKIEEKRLKKILGLEMEEDGYNI